MIKTPITATIVPMTSYLSGGVPSISQPHKIDILEQSIPEEIVNNTVDNSKEYPKIQNGSFIANIPSSPNSYSTRVSVIDFDSYANSFEIKKEHDAVSSCYVYGYKGRYVVAEIKANNCSTIKGHP